MIHAWDVGVSLLLFLHVTLFVTVSVKRLSVGWPQTGQCLSMSATLVLLLSSTSQFQTFLFRGGHNSKTCFRTHPDIPLVKPLDNALKLGLWEEGNVWVTKTTTLRRGKYMSHENCDFEKREIYESRKLWLWEGANIWVTKTGTLKRGKYMSHENCDFEKEQISEWRKLWLWEGANIWVTKTGTLRRSKYLSHENWDFEKEQIPESRRVGLCEGGNVWVTNKEQNVAQQERSFYQDTLNTYFLEFWENFHKRACQDNPSHLEHKRGDLPWPLLFKVRKVLNRGPWEYGACWITQGNVSLVPFGNTLKTRLRHWLTFSSASIH
jgi:hypothetical protein